MVEPETGKRIAPLEVRCSHIYPDGRRCRGYRAKADPEARCAGHAGLNGDLAAAGRKGNATQSELRRRRRLLGLQKADPRLLAKVQILERAEEIAKAMVDAVLDDGKLGTLDRQKALLAAHAFAFDERNQAERPTSTTDVQAMSWRAVQTLAEAVLAQSSLLDTNEQSDVIEGRAKSGERATEPRLRTEVAAHAPRALLERA